MEALKRSWLARRGATWCTTTAHRVAVADARSMRRSGAPVSNLRLVRLLACLQAVICSICMVLLALDARVATRGWPSMGQLGRRVQLDAHARPAIAATLAAAKLCVFVMDVAGLFVAVALLQLLPGACSGHAALAVVRQECNLVAEGGAPGEPCALRHAGRRTGGCGMPAWLPSACHHAANMAVGLLLTAHRLPLLRSPLHLRRRRVVLAHRGVDAALSQLPVRCRGQRTCWRGRRHGVRALHVH